MSQPQESELPLSGRPLEARGTELPPVSRGLEKEFAGGELPVLGQEQQPQQPTIVTHEPIVQTQHVHHQPVQYKQEHHVQPVVQQTQHHIHPIQQTQVTSEQPIIPKEETIVHPVVDAGVVQQPVAGMGQQQPGLGLQQPQQQGTGFQQPAGGLGQRQGGLVPDLEEKERMASMGMGGVQQQPSQGVPFQQQPLEKQIPISGESNLEPVAGEMTTGPLPATGVTPVGHATLGQKLKGTAKQVAGTLTGNQALKEEGKTLRREGVDTTTPTSGI